MFQSAARQCMQLVTHTRALLAWLFTLVQAPKDHVQSEAPEKEARGCAASEEERGYEEEQCDANGEEGVDEGGGEGEE